MFPLCTASASGLRPQFEAPGRAVMPIETSAGLVSVPKDLDSDFTVLGDLTAGVGIWPARGFAAFGASQLKCQSTLTDVADLSLRDLSALC